MATMAITNLPLHKHVHLKTYIDIYECTTSHKQLAIFILNDMVFLGFFPQQGFIFLQAVLILKMWG